MNEKTKAGLLTYWKEILIIVLMGVGVFLWIEYNSVKEEVAKKTDTPASVLDHEANVYPQIDGKIKTLDEDIQNLKLKRNVLKKNTVTMKDVEKDLFKNYTSKDTNTIKLSEYFKQEGFDNKIIKGN